MFETVNKIFKKGLFFIKNKKATFPLVIVGYYTKNKSW